MKRHPHVANRDELEWISDGNGERFEFKRKWFTPETGARKLGCSLYRIAAGKTAFPHHRHFANEEAIYVLAGTGRLRIDAAEVAVGPGDYIALPAEGPAHQLINSGSEDLEYLCMSTMIHPDLTYYPDSDKVAAFAGSGPGGDKSVRSFNAVFRAGSAVDYYDGE